EEERVREDAGALARIEIDPLPAVDRFGMTEQRRDARIDRDRSRGEELLERTIRIEDALPQETLRALLQRCLQRLVVVVFGALAPASERRGVEPLDEQMS